MIKKRVREGEKLKIEENKKEKVEKRIKKRQEENGTLDWGDGERGEEKEEKEEKKLEKEAGKHLKLIGNNKNSKYNLR